MRQNIQKMIFTLGLMGIFLTGCAQNVTAVVPTSTLEGRLTPYLTATPSLTPDSATPKASLTPTEIPVPTSTPFVYTVVENDTLTAIAVRHSVTLEDLLAANPGLDPNFLTIGLTLTIPLEGVVAAVLPTATPIPIEIYSPACYLLADGSLQCMAVVENQQSFAVENIVALISLQTPNGGDPISKTATTPLNWVPAGKKAAVAVTFEPPLPPEYVPHADLLTAIPVSDDDTRYLQTELELNKTEIFLDGYQARVSGLLTPLGGEVSASTVWIAAFAYDAENNIVGIRKWIADDAAISAGQIEFDFPVYSLGPPITSVEVLVEARP